MNHAGRSDQLIGRITAEVEITDRRAHFERDRPGVNRGEGSSYFRGIDIELNTVELGKLCDLPEDNRRNAPCVSAQKLLFGRLQLVG